MRALISVYDKANLSELVNAIKPFISEIYATSGTSKYLSEIGVQNKDTSTLTGFSELLGGRVKTLHPAIFAGILSTESERDLSQMENFDFPLFDLVVANLYPFEDAAKSHDLKKMVENIDIGGVSLIRAAAKNYDRVTVLSSPLQYETVIAELKETSTISEQTRRRLALEAFSMVSNYDISIYGSLSKDFGNEVPDTLFLRSFRGRKLRYGENPDQDGFLYSDLSAKGIANAVPLQGKEMSYNNILDANSAFETILEFNATTAVVLKHNTPCGVASAETLPEALKRAIAGDPESAYGSVIAVNREFDRSSFEAISKLFVEVLIAPEYSDEALLLLTKKKNLRVLKVPMEPDMSYRARSISNGILLQSPLRADIENLVLKTERSATEEQIKDMIFAWKVVAHCRSNAIVLSKGMQTVGIGAGQTSRIEALRIAVARAKERVNGSVLASDAFFPFEDNVELAASSGISAIIQPGGSIRDDVVIAKSNESKIPMYFTGKRVFLH